ncbi:LptF/LptG family permease [Hymenobacter chitinivorans]|uniref:Lipopolysaccharide export system permease protein n=1 Tax=Hymenobacter chitinivorans DSM 11115 TaxID=1121954 RepID=A0A2M9BQZ6_9BACT|nr:LptF/LptG family permease [Hymenobacter chitinivorans]PJJ60364.1 lipopolysaccharide export system permease protein [Hymenobacter chitinivorans DSM 11115]
MKKLDKLILRAFAGPFLLTFAVVQFILLMVTLLKYMDDLIGKDLGWQVITKLIMMFSVITIPTALPLAVLLSSLMTYGNLGEHHELTAIKSSGISLLRILRPVMILSVVLAGLAFWFNNRIVPSANLETFSLLWDVRQQKLALDIREGVFYNGLPGITIKVNKKEGENGDRLKGVMIYDHRNGQGNATVILADSGRMFTRFNGGYLSLELFHGRTYIEQPDARDRAGASFYRQAFDRNLITFSLSSFNLSLTDKKLFAENKMMKNIPQLQQFTDSLHNKLVVERQQFPRQLNPYYVYLRLDTTGQALRQRVENWQVPTTKLPVVNTNLLDQAENRVRNLRTYVGSSSEHMSNLAKEAGNFRIEIYKKYTQSVAVLLMFLIGAPLGAIIKKGGLGVPVLISIVFFIVYYVLSIIGEKYAREGVMPVASGVWMATVLLLPVGLFFLNQARRDSGLLETDIFGRLFRKIKLPLRGYKKAAS